MAVIYIRFQQMKTADEKAYSRLVAIKRALEQVPSLLPSPLFPPSQPPRPIRDSINSISSDLTWRCRQGQRQRGVLIELADLRMSRAFSRRMRVLSRRKAPGVLSPPSCIPPVFDFREVSDGHLTERSPKMSFWGEPGERTAPRSAQHTPRVVVRARRPSTFFPSDTPSGARPCRFC